MNTNNGLRATIGLLLSLPICAARADGTPTFKPYGFINADIIGASRGLDSFGNTNLSAPTAVTPSSASNSNRARDSFQVAQSRLGLFVEHSSLVGHFEVDFIDFTKATPTTQALPRLRIANIDYKITPNQTLSFGQDWDLFAAPAKPFTYNIVGLYFHTGNVGFMRPQLKYRYKTNSDWTFGAALGLTNKNPSASDGEIEMTALPTASLLISHRISHKVDAGISGIFGGVRPASYPADISPIYGLNTFVSWETDSGFKLRESLYYGANLASTGALSLASALTSGSKHEVGGYVTALQPLSEHFSIQGGFGAAGVLDDGGSTLDGLVGNNVLYNWKAELAISYQPIKQLTIYLQPSFYQTSYLQVASNTTDLVNATALQLGSLFQF